MKEKRRRELKEELKYLLASEINKELLANEEKINNENINIKELAKEIYLSRGLDISKINHGIFDNLINSLSEFGKVFKNKDKDIKSKMIIEIVYISILLLLMKIPFDLIRDIGYEYIEIISNRQLFYNLWSLGFLLLYTITFGCSFVVLIRNFVIKYKNN